MNVRSKHLLGISLLLALGTFVAFRPVTGCGFVNFDDPRYLDIPHVQSGLTIANAVWALTATHASNWHPLTWISLMLDRSLYGDKPLGYHIASLLLHIASTVLLFLLLARITGSMWRSAFVAALFGIHPLHVESVAWIAERKDVLSAFFMMLTLWAYVLYTEKPTLKRSLAAIALFALGLMAKPMLVTLPLVLLLLDYWPLRRLKSRQVILEKLPFFALAGASCVITVLAQHRVVASLVHIPLWLRAENGAVSYMTYICQMVWPARLAFFYPYTAPAAWKVVSAAVLLLCVTAVVLRKRRSHPYLAVGWLWYLGTLVPVIGLVQVGDQAMADRYTYLPLIGLFIAIAWGAADMIRVRKIAPALAIIVLLCLGIVTWRQAGYWHDSTSLSRHAIAVTRDNYEAYCMLGVALTDQGKPQEAAEQLARAILIKPKSAYAHAGLANALAQEDKFDLAVAEYEKAIRLDPNYVLPHYNLGLILEAQGRLDEAIEHLSRAREINAGRSAQPEMARAGAIDEAIARIERDREARTAKPTSAEAHFYLANGLSDKRRAIAEYREAIRLKPDFAAAHNNLAVDLYMTGRYAEAWKEVHLCEKYGLQPPADFIKALTEKLPDH